MGSETLKFVLGDGQLKAFRTCLAGLYKIGSNLMVIGTRTQICLNACNGNRSAFVSTALKRSFFTAYEYSDDIELQVVLSFRNVLPIIRTSRVRTASFSLIPTANILIASLECDNGMMKEYRMPFIEEQNFSSRVPRDLPHIEFMSDPGSLSKVLSTFHSGVDIIAIKCDPSQSMHDTLIEFRTYMMQDEVAQNSLHTLLEFRSNIAFRSFKNTLGIPTEVAFNLKDFSSIVTTAENLGASLTIMCSTPGEPLLVVCSILQDIEIELILSTLPGEVASQNLRPADTREPTVFHANEDDNPFDMATGAGEELVSSPQGSPFRSQEGGPTLPGFIA